MAGKPPRLQTTTSLWLAIAFFSVIAGMVLCAPMLGTFPEGKEWHRLGALLVLGGFFGAIATAVGVSHLSELVRRGAWVPPGTARYPALVAIILVVLLAAPTFAFMLTVARLLERSGL
jgi:hypothetical protein